MASTNVSAERDPLRDMTGDRVPAGARGHARCRVDVLPIEPDALPANLDIGGRRHRRAATVAAIAVHDPEPAVVAPHHTRSPAANLPAGGQLRAKRPGGAHQRVRPAVQVGDVDAAAMRDHHRAVGITRRPPVVDQPPPDRVRVLARRRSGRGARSAAAPVGVAVAEQARIRLPCRRSAGGSRELDRRQPRAPAPRTAARPDSGSWRSSPTRTSFARARSAWSTSWASVRVGSMPASSMTSTDRRGSRAIGRFRSSASSAAMLVTRDPAPSSSCRRSPGERRPDNAVPARPPTPRAQPPARTSCPVPACPITTATGHRRRASGAAPSRPARPRWSVAARRTFDGARARPPRPCV